MSSDPPTPDQIAFDLITQLRGGDHPPTDASGTGPWQAVILALADAYADGGTQAVELTYRALVKADRRLMKLMSSLDASPVHPLPASCARPHPLLPAVACLPEQLWEGASPWMEAYIAFSRKWSPRAYLGFHEACGLWILSTVAGRRVVLDFGGPHYTPLFIALVAYTTLHAKSVTAKLARDVIEQAGLGWLLGADDTTPQKLISDMAGRLPTEYHLLSADKQELARLRLSMSGQRGWFFDEFGQHLAAMAREHGSMADFKGLLRRLDDCNDSYTYATHARGSETIASPYLALLASMTPADMKPLAARDGALWHDGYWARFAFVTPAREDRSRARFPLGKRVIPTELLTPLVAWHGRLGLPALTMEPVRTKQGEETGHYQVERGPLPETACRLAPGIVDAYYTYHDTLLDLAQEQGLTHLLGNYGRLAIKALRIAMLLASLENQGQIDMKHWAYGQAVAERWRRDLHELITQLAERDDGKEEAEARIREVIARLGQPTAREMRMYDRTLKALPDLPALLDEMVKNGLISRMASGQTVRYGTLQQAEEGADKREQ